MRSVVVLPHPEGPSSVKNSPSRISRFTRSTAATAPKRLVRFSMRRKLIGPLLCADTDFEAEGARNERDAERQRHDEDDRDARDLAMAGSDLIEREEDQRARLGRGEQDDAGGVL